MRRLQARYTLLGAEVVEGAAVDVDGGQIVAVHRQRPGGPAPEGGEIVELGEAALVPGLINAHSHAFQRDIRGRTEWLHRNRPREDFWSWREAMYRAALQYTPDELERVARRAYWEMASTGITCVGEFHYLHHQPDGTPYEDPNELAHRVIRAARQVGLRIVLLRVAYHRAGWDRPADPMQRRFVEPDPETYLARLEALQEAWARDPMVTVGAAPHSVRAVPGGWLEAIGERAHDAGWPLHIHACEQRAEIAQCVAEYGRTPPEVLRDLGALGPASTLIHATHLRPRDVEILGESGATVCACPSTERNLGDGFLPALALARAGVPMCLGTDSHTSIDVWEEARLVEYHERLRYERRNVLAQAPARWCPEAPGAERREVARRLWPMATAYGARALGLEGARIEPGAPADLVALSLEHPSLLGTDPEALLADLTLSVKPGAVRDVLIGGEDVVRRGRHVHLEPAELVG